MRFVLTNAQRECFGIEIVDSGWQMIELKKSTYDTYDSLAYIDGNKVRKLIQTGEAHYCEYTLSEELSEDRQWLLPKTAKGKPVKLSASALAKRTAVGMAIRYEREYISVYHATTDQGYFRSASLEIIPKDISDFAQWVQNWCEETTEQDLLDVQSFARRERARRKYAEGDFFRLRLDRRYWIYGRILLNVAQMRKDKVAFWDLLPGQPLVVGIYHLLTDRPISDIGLIADRPMLPSEALMDNIFYYGEAEIIGNRPLQRYEQDYPIHYDDSIRPGQHSVRLQYGRIYREVENEHRLFRTDFKNGGGSFFPNVTLRILRSCIAAGSNLPYWTENRNYLEDDLRNPKYALQRRQVFEQFGLDMETCYREDLTIEYRTVPQVMDNYVWPLIEREDILSPEGKRLGRHYIYCCPCGKGRIEEYSFLDNMVQKDRVHIDCVRCAVDYSVDKVRAGTWQLRSKCL